MRIVAVQGPVTSVAKNQTAFCTAYQLLISTWIIGTDELATKFSSVPRMGSSTGSPAMFRSSVAVAGSAATTFISLPGIGVCATAIEAFTARLGLSSGIAEKAAGRVSNGARHPSPVGSDARKQKP